MRDGRKREKGWKEEGKDREGDKEGKEESVSSKHTA